MKIKILLTITLNFLLLYVFLLCIDYGIFSNYRIDFNKSQENSNFARAHGNFPYYMIFGSNHKTEDSHASFHMNRSFRGNYGSSNVAPSIIVFGCSFAYGSFIQDKETFAYKLANLTKRPVYNRSIAGWGIQHIYFLTHNETFYEGIEKTPEYAIYIFIPDHMRRMRLLVAHPFSSGRYYNLTLKNHQLSELKPPIYLLYSSYIGKAICEKYTSVKTSPSNMEENWELAEKILVESREALKKRYPHIKFVILKYYGVDMNPLPWTDNEIFWDRLKKDGFIIVDSRDLTGTVLNKEEDLARDYLHPSGKAWDKVIPPLIKKLKL